MSSLSLIAPHYPKAGNVPMVGDAVDRCLQQWHALSDPAMEEELYEIASKRRFADLSLTHGSQPDETPILDLGHFPGRH